MTRIRACAGWLISLAFCMCVSVAAGAQVLLTQVQDTVFHADGSVAQGTVLVSWPAFTTAAGQSVAKGSTSVTLASNGSLSVSLTSNTGATPIGTYYTAVYHLDDGSVTREFWVVPVSTTAVTLAQVRAGVLPTAIAVQTVTKQYVDTAIARAALGATPEDTTPFVQKAGDTMTGPLVLSGDPTTALQASDKNYVDTNVAALQAGLGQKVSTVPIAAQKVTQPAGTELQVDRLNGQLNVKAFQDPGTNDGVTNTLSNADCASGCDAFIERGYPGADRFTNVLPATTHATDRRGGATTEYYFNPHSSFLPGIDVAESLTLTHTESAVAMKQRTNSQVFSSVAENIADQGLTGGNNLYPQNLSVTPPMARPPTAPW